MIKYNKIQETREVQKLSGVICDKCGKFFDNDMDLQEFHHIDFVGGYSSVFGDMNHIKCDICQDCLLEMINDYCRVVDDEW